MAPGVVPSHLADAIDGVAEAVRSLLRGAALIWLLLFQDAGIGVDPSHGSVRQAGVRDRVGDPPPPLAPALGEGKDIGQADPTMATLDSRSERISPSSSNQATNGRDSPNSSAASAGVKIASDGSTVSACPSATGVGPATPCEASEVEVV